MCLIEYNVDILSAHLGVVESLNEVERVALECRAINQHPAPSITNNVVLDQLGHECLSASLGCEEPQVGQPFCFFVTVKQEVQLALELILPDHLLESFFCCLLCCHACSYFLLG